MRINGSHAPSSAEKISFLKKKLYLNKVGAVGE